MDFNKGNYSYMMFLTALLYVLCTLPSFIDSKSIGLGETANMNSIDIQVSYFKRYGYLQSNFDLSKLTKGYSKEAARLFEQAVRDFQAMMGLPVTGILDRDSLNVMSMPRCGLPDKANHDNSRQKRYATFNGLRLKNNNISFRVEPNSYTNDLSKVLTRQILRNALQMWADIANLNFYEYVKPIIEFRFARLSHNDDYDFDGPGGTLAHAFPPLYSNLYSDYLADIHLDDDENWTDKSYNGRNLFQVVTHELGHSFGLNHSNVTTAVMAPVYRGYNPYFAMHKDDIEGIQFLYGPPLDKQAPQTTPVPGGLQPQPRQPYPPQQEPTDPNKCAYNYCSCPRAHAITTTHDRNVIFAFNGIYVYKVDPFAGVKSGYPKLTGEVFPNFSGTVDAALTWPKNVFRNAFVVRLFLFQDQMVYTYHMHDNGTITHHDKERIADRFDGVTGPVNVSLVWSGNSLTYLFSGSQYYRITTNGDGRSHEDYPRPLRAWGFPENKIPDSGFQYYNSYTYFFFGNSYYRYNDNNVAVENITYPRNIGQWWFGCEPSNLVDESYSTRWQREPLTKFEMEKLDRALLGSDSQANGCGVVFINLLAMSVSMILGSSFV